MVNSPRAPNITPRHVTILGATGSVGLNTIDLISRDRDAYLVEALTANRNAEELAKAARRVGAKYAAVADESAYGALKAALSGSGIEAGAGAAGVIEAAERPADWVMAAIVGAAGLAPTMAAVRRGAVVALANKECLVCAGDLVVSAVKESGATMLPVDSEHSAVFQVFDFEQREKIEKIILTASGGPFLDKDPSSLGAVTPEQAVAHPNWDMGAKISVDSATMMNKGLELIEAGHLFDMGPDRLEVLVHPQSIIHSMVAYVDGSVLAQLGTPDMRTPIAYALGWPARMAAPCERLDLAKIGSLSFRAPDYDKFRCLALAREAMAAGGAAPTVLNAANEVAVAAFLDRRIGFLEIPRLVERVLERLNPGGLADLQAVYQVDAEARRLASDMLVEVAAPV